MGVFISYSHADVNSVTTIVKVLKEHSNQEVWYDHELRGGDQYFSVIANQILKNEFFIFVVSDHSVKSDWCIRELQFAMSEGKKIIAVWLEDISIPPGVRLVIQNTHYVNFESSNEELLAKNIERCFSGEVTLRGNSQSEMEDHADSINEKYFVAKKDVERIKHLLIDEEKGKYSQCFLPENAVLLGLAYELGINTQKNDAKALFYYRVGIFNGSEDARFLYEAMKINDAENPRPHLIEMKKAAENGSAVAMTYYGDICYQGNYGVEKNVDEAVAFWKKAAEMGSPVSQYYMAYAYRWGDGVEKDYCIALMYALKSTEQKFPRGYRILGFMHDYGNFVEKDIEKAKYYYEKAIKYGDYLSLCYLGNIHYYDYKNYDQSIKCYSRAVEYADEGKIKSGTPYFRMGVSLRYGDGIEEDKEKACEFYIKAVERGHKKAKEYIVGLLREVYKDSQLLEKLKWASENGCEDADYYIGKALEEGSTREALKYYDKGAQLGDVYCVLRLISYHSKILGSYPEYENRELALKYYELFFSLLGTKEVSENLTKDLDIYYYGYACDLDYDSIKPDKPLALYYFKKCLEESDKFIHNIIGFAIDGFLFPGRSGSGLEKDIIHCRDILAFAEDAFEKHFKENPEDEKNKDTLGLLIDAYYHFEECHKKGNVLPKSREMEDKCKEKVRKYTMMKYK